MKIIPFNSIAFVFFLFLSVNIHAQTQLFVATNGNDSNSGTIESPLKTLIGARDKIRSIKTESGLPTAGVVVNFREGRYPVTSVCRFDSQDSGDDISSITYRGYADEEVIFDGSIFVNNSKFEVTTNTQTNVLHNTAVGNVYFQKINNIELINLLAENTAQLSMNDKMMQVARFPNLGFGHVNDGSINSGSEQKNVDGTVSSPAGASFKMVEGFNATKWHNELQRTQRAAANGYMSADWHKEYLRVADVSTNGTITLMDGTSYGLRDRSGPNRFFMSQLLCELDEPGEWYFDTKEHNLYIWPYDEINEESKIGVWAGTQLVEVHDCEYINFEKMTIQCLGKGENGDGALNFRSGSNFLVAGVTFRYIAKPLLACNFWGDVSNSTMLSCNFFDIWNNTRLYGGSFTSEGNILVGNNAIENCHFTQIYSKDLYGKACGMNGVGNVFRNNLIHNMNGQPLTHAGIDHTLELNEVFNVGIEEGDGGAFYTGNDVISYGNIIRHNFMHHIMSVPKLLGRAAFFSDDYDGGELIEENVLYKGGWEAIKMNKGAGHTVRKNVILDCYTGIRQGTGGTSGYNSSMKYINSNPTSNDKNNYIGRMLKKVGKSGWETGLSEANWNERIEPFWKDRYPTFAKVMDAYASSNKMNAFECLYSGNLFWSNKNNAYGGSGTVVIEESHSVELNIFENTNNLNFKFNASKPEFAPDIPFENIGLYPDTFRCGIPNKEDYRRAVKQRFAHLACHTSDSYNPETINERLYYNTGKMVMSLVPCQGNYSTVDFYFDFGTATSKLFPNYERVSNATQPGAFGWTNTEGLNAVDRAEFSGLNDLNRDLIYCSSPKIFEVNVPNGTYNVLITFGDARYNHDNIIVKAEGELKLSNINTQKGDNFFNKDFDVVVNDEKLSVEFADGGGTDDVWVATRMIVRQKSIATGGEELKLSNDFKLYPNPANDYLNIEFSNASQQNKGKLIVFNSNGNAVITKQLIGNQTRLAVDALTPGMYIVRIINENEIITRKFIKR